MYPIRITKILAGTNNISQVYISGLANISDYYYLAPGEEKYFGQSSWRFSLPINRDIQLVSPAGGSYSNYLRATSLCFAPGQGTAQVNDFGFEYIEYLDNNQQITKRQVGKPIIIKCTS
jgi:hypothetical protein